MTRDRFDRLEIYPIREEGDQAFITDDDHADFYSLYGYIEGEGIEGIYIAIGDYPTRAAAELTCGYLAAFQTTRSAYHLE